MGKAGSGKDTLLKALFTQPQFKEASPIISCTTRPIRENEKDGIDYHFLTNEEFTNQLLQNEMIEATVFNTWCYGTSIKNLNSNKLNIGVFNPEGVEILRSNPQIELMVVYITASDKIRLLRQLNREEHPNCDEIVRRFGTDKQDFKASRINAISPDVVIENNGELDIDTIARRFIIKYYNFVT